MGEAAPALLTVDEVADYLRTSRVAVYHLIERGKLPGVVKVGRRLLVKRLVLEKSLSLDETIRDRAGK
jgi:excisionase family DNA binding protein